MVEGSYGSVPQAKSFKLTKQLAQKAAKTWVQGAPAVDVLRIHAEVGMQSAKGMIEYIINRVVAEEPPTAPNDGSETELERLKRKNWYAMAAVVYHDNFVLGEVSDANDSDVLVVEEKLKYFYDKYGETASARLSALMRRGTPTRKFFFYQAPPNTVSIQADEIIVSYCHESHLNEKLKQIIFCVRPKKDTGDRKTVPWTKADIMVSDGKYISVKNRASFGAVEDPKDLEGDDITYFDNFEE